MAENPRCAPNVCCISTYRFTPWTYFVNQKSLNIPCIRFACEYLKVLVSLSSEFFAKLLGLAQALICCVKASYCPWRMCNRNGHCWNHKWVNGKTWKIAFLKLEAAVIFLKLFVENWKERFFLGPQGTIYWYIIYIYNYVIYICIYMYMHNTYQICIYIQW